MLMKPRQSLNVISDIIKLAKVDSTNRYALESGRPGLLVIAGTQTAGRGRRGRSWFSPEGENLYMTLTVAPPEGRYPVIAGVAVRDAIEGLVQDPGADIKWPNDIVIAGKKVCGILCETRGGITAVGIGVNVNQEAWPYELEPRAISLKQATNRDFCIDEVAKAVAEHLCMWIEAFRCKGFGPIRDQFLCHGLLQAYEVFDDEGKRCTIVDLTMEGHLVIDVDGTRRDLIHEPVGIGWEKGA